MPHYLYEQTTWVGWYSPSTNPSYWKHRVRPIRRIFLVSNIILVLGAIASILLASFLIKPIKELSVGVDELKKGIAKSPLKIYSDDELGQADYQFQ